MQADTASAMAAGIAVLWIIFVGVPALATLVAFFIMCSRIRQIRDEVRRQTIILESVRTSAEGSLGYLSAMNGQLAKLVIAGSTAKQEGA